MKFGLSRNNHSALGAALGRSLSAMLGATLVFALMVVEGEAPPVVVAAAPTGAAVAGPRRSSRGWLWMPTTAIALWKG